MESNSFSDVKWIPTFSRDLRLGCLYDCCTDEEVIGSSIWDKKAIQEAIIENEDNIPEPECETYKLHNINKKVKCLGINGELYLSCAAGHIKLEGETKFYNDDVPSKTVLSALRYYTPSKVIQLSANCILNSAKIHTFEQERATDVITGILYGAISIIVCYQKVQDTHDITAAYENVHTKTKYLQSCILENYTEMFSSIESNSENITCKIFSTLDLKKKESIISYTDTIAICKDLLKLHADKSKHVPIEVSLVPLTKINKKHKKRARNITKQNLIIKVQNMHDTMNKMVSNLVNLQSSADNTLPCVTELLESYHKSNINLKCRFVQILCNLVPKYRKGYIKESVLEEEINSLDDNLQKLYFLVQYKLREVQKIHSFIKAIRDNELTIISSDDHFKNDYVICLEFNTIHFIGLELPEKDKLWYDDRKVIVEIYCKIKQFLKFAKENGNKEGIKFGFGEFSNKECKELVLIRVCLNNEVLFFEPPTPPGKPKEAEITESTIALNWSEPQQGAQFIFSYCIYFRKAADDTDKWNLHSFKNCNNRCAKIENLEARTGYIFKVSATLIIHCITIESQVSEIIYTNKLNDAKTVERNSVTNPTNLDSPSSDSQEMTSRNRSNTAFNHSKRFAAASNQTDRTGQFEDKTAPQEMEKRCSQEKDTYAHRSIQNINIVPRSSAIKSLYDASKCKQLNIGSPSLYKLHVTKEPVKLTDVKIFNFGGNYSLQLTKKIILLVGATGAGKTTLINGMVNYIFGVEWNDPERLVLAECYTDKEGPSQAESQTKSVEVYKINHSKDDQLSYNLTIIDTPGFDNTEGLKKDQKIVEKIKTLLTSDKVIDHIDVIGFVVQAPFSRLTPTQSYVIHSVYSLFSEDVTNNVFILATFTDDLSSPPILDGIAEAKIQHNQILKFNSSALYADTNKTDVKCLLNKSLWEIGMESFSTFFRELEKVNPVSLALTKELLNERKTLQCLGEGLQKKINCEFMNMQKLEHEEQALKNYNNKAKKNEKFQYQEYIVEHELLPLTSQGQWATNCDKCKITCHGCCLENCDHGQCNMVMYEQTATFKGFICKVCRCPMSEHTTSKHFYQAYTGTETKTIKHLVQKYDKAQSAQINVEKLIAKITNELDNVHKIAHTKLIEMHKCIQKINMISLQPIMISKVDYISTLIASENYEKTEGYMSRVKFYQKLLKEFQRNNEASDNDPQVSQV